MDAPSEALNRIALAVLLGLGAWLGPAGSAAAAEAEDPGRDAFVAQKCNLCHAGGVPRHRGQGQVREGPQHGPECGRRPPGSGSGSQRS